MEAMTYKVKWIWPDAASISAHEFDLEDLPSVYREAEAAGAIAVAIPVDRG